MDLPHTFTHLSLEILWPYEGLTVSDLAVVPVLGQPFPPLAVLNICVRRHCLFRDCPASHIRDVRETNRAQWNFRCQNREQLIHEITFALSEYNTDMTEWDSWEQTKFEERLQWLTTMRQEGQTFQRWFKRRGRWDDRISRSGRRSGTALPHALDVVESFYQSWSKVFALSPRYQRRACQRAISKLYASFITYGPLRGERPTYPDEALYAAIYSILVAFGVESCGDMKNGSRRIAYATRSLRESAARDR
jgi:hypothetical protein